MYISKISCRDFKKFSEIVVKVDGTGRRVEFGGPTGHGKTTMLQALDAGLFGIKPVKIRPGARETEVEIELDDMERMQHVEIRRTRSASGQTLDVRNNGKRETRAAEFIRDVLGIESVNPLALLDPATIKAELMRLLGVRVSAEAVAARLGVDPAELPGNVDWDGDAVEVVRKVRDWFAGQRTEAGRSVKAKAAVLEDAIRNLPPERPAPDFSAADLAAMEGGARDTLAIERGKAGAILGATNRLSQVDAAIRSANNKVRELEDELARQKAAIVSLKDEKATLEAKLQESGPDQERITEAEAILATVAERRIELREHEAAGAQREACRIVREEHGQADARWQALEVKVQALGPAFVSELIAGADAALPGLAWDGERFLYGPCPVEELSDGERIRLAAKLGMRRKAGIKVMCVDGLEKLSSDHYEALNEEVGDDPEVLFWSTRTTDEPYEIGATVEVSA